MDVEEERGEGYKRVEVRKQRLEGRIDVSTDDCFAMRFADLVLRTFYLC